MHFTQWVDFGVTLVPGISSVKCHANGQPNQSRRCRRCHVVHLVMHILVVVTFVTLRFVAFIVSIMPYDCLCIIYSN